MKEAFVPYISDVIRALLDGASDDVQCVREVAMRASKVICAQFGSQHTALLLPSLDEAVFNADWRVRHCAVQLLGSLIEQIMKEGQQHGDLLNSEVLSRERRAYML